MTAPRTTAAQVLVIRDWHPQTSPNSQRRHWRDVQKRHHGDRDVVIISARAAGWTFVPGKVRLSITLVYPRKYRVDADNLVARCKGLIDGLKSTNVPFRHTGLPNCCRSKCQYLQDDVIRYTDGFFQDDDTEHLEIVVRADVRPGVKATEITLEPVQ